VNRAIGLISAYGLTQSGAPFALLGPALVAAGVGGLIFSDGEIG
jgi:hypothetical protein